MEDRGDLPIQPLMSNSPLPEQTAMRTRPGRLLGDVVVGLSFCDRETVEQCVHEARMAGRPMGQLLIERGALSVDQLAIAIAERFGLQYVDLRMRTEAFDVVLMQRAGLTRS